MPLFLYFQYWLKFVACGGTNGFTCNSALLAVFVTLIELVEGVNPLPFGVVAVLVVRIPCFVGPAALWTPFRIAGKAFRLEEFLFPGGKSECSPAIGTLHRLALKNHWMLLSLLNFS
jgi:hypothetical protein